MVTKMRKSMIIVALAVIICLIAAALSVDFVRNNAYAAETAAPALSLSANDEDTLVLAWEEAVAEENEGKLVKIELSDDITMSDSFVLSADVDVVVDLNGHSILTEGVGSVFAVNAGSLTLSSATTVEISGHKDNNAALIDVQNASLNVNGVNFKDNMGGAINAGNAKVNLTNCVISGNTAQQGAGLRLLNKSEATLDLVIIDGNKATLEQSSNAGGIYSSASNLVIKDSKINDNLSNAGGAGVVVDGGSVKLEGRVEIFGNKVGNLENGIAKNLFVNANANVEVGKLDDNANVYVTEAGNIKAFASNFAQNNVDKNGLPLNPASFFMMDDTSKVVALDSDGNVCSVTSDNEIEWTINTEKVNGYGITFVYQAKTISNVQLNGGENLLSAGQTIENVNRNGNKVVANVVTAEIDGKTLALNVLITPKDISDVQASLKGLDANNAVVFSVNIPEIETSLKPEDYSFVDTGINVSNEASITLVGRGNYTGKKVLSYKIVPNDTLKYTVEWQVNDNGWKTLDTLTFGVDYTSNVRAKLTIERFGGGYTEYVYAQGVTPDDDNSWNGNLSVSFSGAGTSLRNAGNYTATINGQGNVGFEANANTKQITIKQAASIGATDLANEKDSLGNSLWKVYFGAEELNYVTNDTKNAMDLVDGAYSRASGSNAKLLLNGSYMVGDTALKTYLDSAAVTYANNEQSAVGTHNVTAQIVLNGNFTSAATINLTKAWEIKNVNNELRTNEGTTILGDGLGSWSYGVNPNAVSFRPEHGNTVIITVATNGGEVVQRFAIVYLSNNLYSAVKYYEVKADGGALVADLDKEIKSNNDYYNNVLAGLQAGSYTITVYAPAVAGTAKQDKHWWDQVECDHEAETFDALSYTFKANVSKLDISRGDANVVVEIVNNKVNYNGHDNNTPEIVLKNFNGITYVAGVDYELTSTDVNIGVASFTVVGKGGLTGSLVVADSYEIVKAENSWVDLPNVMDWTWQSYDRTINLITGKPDLLDDPHGVWFKVTTDSQGNNPVNDRLARFYFAEDGLIEGTASDALVNLPVGTYYLFATVDSTDNYNGLSQNPVTFTVFQAHNHWNVAPSVTTWVDGSFSMDINLPQATSAHGTANIVIYAYGDEMNVIFDSVNGINNLDSAPAGRYTLKASVSADVNGNFTGIDVYSVDFDIFQKAGLPWWAVVALIVCSLGIAALIIFILIKAGVLNILTNKLTVAIRTKATIDATIAAVRAHKMQEEGKKSVAAAKARERAEQRKQEKEADLARPIEERAKDLELKAQQEAERAERIRARAAKMHEQVASMREQAQDEAAATTTDNSTDK